MLKTYFGSSAANNVSFTASADPVVMYGLGGNDNLTGSAFNDLVYGGEGADLLTGGQGDDRLAGGVGDDDLIGGGGADYLDGGAGFDLASYFSATSGVIANLVTGGTGGDALGDTYVSVEWLVGSDHDDVLTGDAGNNFLTSNRGNDILNGGAGQDLYRKGAVESANVVTRMALGDEALSVASAFNLAYGAAQNGKGIVVEFDTVSNTVVAVDRLFNIEGLTGHSGRDIMVGDNADNIFRGTAGDDVVSGKGGFDLVDYRFTGRIEVDLQTNSADVDGDQQTLVSIEGVRGSSSGDTIIGNASSNMLAGGAGRDALLGQNGNDTLFGESGDDILYGGADNDILDGGVGRDLLDGGSGFDLASYVTETSGSLRIDMLMQNLPDDFVSIEGVIGSTNDDYIRGDSGANRLIGFLGNDELYGCDGDDVLFGDFGGVSLRGMDGIIVDFEALGYDCLCAEPDAKPNLEVFLDLESGANDLLWGGKGNDTAFGQIGNDLLFGATGNDTLNGGAGTDILFGGSGNDLLEGGSSFDFIFGGTGIDTATYENSVGGVTVNLSSTFGNSGGEAEGRLIDEMLGSLSGPRSFSEFIGDAALFAGLSAIEGIIGDTLVIPDFLGSIENVVGSGFNDIILGADNVNTLFGGAGNDFLSGQAGADVLLGEAGNDRLVGGAGNDTLLGGLGADKNEGGSGIDTVSYSGASGVSVNLATGVASRSHAAGDTFSSIENIIGSSGNDVLSGTVGANTISGGAGNDFLSGGAGNDRLEGGSGADRHLGGSGIDTADFSNDTAGVTVDLASGTGTRGTAQGDQFDSIENLVGGSGVDVLLGNSAANRLSGNAGNDFIRGFGGNDLLGGNAGADRFGYGRGDDRDTVVDFQNNVDVLDLRAFNFTSASQALSFASQSGADTVFDFGGGDILIVENILNGFLGDDILI